MARPPRPWHSRGVWYTDFGRRNRLLIRGPKDAATRLLAEKALLQMREEVQLLARTGGGADTPFAIVVERFLEAYAGRPAYVDFADELHRFMGADLGAGAPGDRAHSRRGQERPSGGRFGVPCKAWPIRRINAQLVEDYLRRRRTAGLSGFHAFVALRTLMNWAKKKEYIPDHDLDGIDKTLRRKGRRRYLPADQDVVRIFEGATGRFKELVLVYMLTGIRPSDLRSVLIDEFDRPKRQWVLWRHKVVERTRMPKIVPLPTDEVLAICEAAAGDGRETSRCF